jgi:hypothetical protein
VRADITTLSAAMQVFFGKKSNFIAKEAGEGVE